MRALEKAPPDQNSRGRSIYPTEEGTDAFWRWFGDSKVVDAQGRPLVMYHGTDADFEKFKVDDNFVAYFTPKSEVASDHAEFMAGANDGNASIMPVYLKIDNPVTLNGDLSSYIGYEPASIADLKASGHDGIVSDDGHEIIVFYPEQIKSASGNDGTFDPNDPYLIGRHHPCHSNSPCDRAEEIMAALRASPGGESKKTVPRP